MARDLDQLRKVFLKAEQDIINEISGLLSRGLIDYHKQAALKRVQRILKSLEDECWKYVPKMVERHFYVSHPERYTRAPILFSFLFSLFSLLWKKSRGVQSEKSEK